MRITSPFLACVGVQLAKPGSAKSYELNVQVADLDSLFTVSLMKDPARAHRFAESYLQSLTSQLEQELKNIEEFDGCVKEIGSDFEWPERCESLPMAESYKELMYTTMPQLYHQLRYAIAFAFPPGAYGPSEQLWNFEQQVNLNGKILSKWPLARGRLEPLTDGSVAMTNKEIQAVEARFFQQWDKIINDYLDILEEKDKELKKNGAYQDGRFQKIGASLEQALYAKSPRQRAYLAGTISDQDWQQYIRNRLAGFRLSQTAEIISLVSKARPLVFFKKAMIYPSDVHAALEQMIAANIRDRQAIAKDLKTIKDDPYFSELEALPAIGKYMQYHRQLELYLIEHEQDCGIATAIWVRAGNHELRHTIDLLIPSIVFAWYAAPELATAGFLGLNTIFFSQKQKEFNEKLDYLAAQLDNDSAIVTPFDVLKAGQDIEGLTLMYPIIGVGGFGVLKMLKPGSQRVLPISFTRGGKTYRLTEKWSGQRRSISLQPAE